MIDLRSDTVTRPTEAMRRVMAEAEVGDDAYGEDPTARRLEERAAAELGKEAALFVPSGTMANQIALLVHCRAGDEVIMGRGNHIAHYEGGAGGAWAGVQLLPVGEGGRVRVGDVEPAIKPPAYYHPRSRLVALENTHNRAGGRVLPQPEVEAVADCARRHGMAVHIDGARIWNAAAATGRPPAELCAPADTVSACFSKGLGAPVGSVLAGTREHIDRARRFRHMLGGGMRQVGVLCAAALYALDHHVQRLIEDHRRARRLAEGLAGLTGLECDPATVETNIVLCELESEAPVVVDALASSGVRVNAVSSRRVRAVTHLDVTDADIEAAIGAFGRVARG